MMAGQLLFLTSMVLLALHFGVDGVDLPEGNNPCEPSPCGAGAVCKAHQGVAICACLPGFSGSPPHCTSAGERRARRTPQNECDELVKCPNKLTCIKHKCEDACHESFKVCGSGANCTVLNNIPTCSCPQGRTGNPFVHCELIEEAAK